MNQTIGPQESHKTCKVTLVDPGRSDRVIKIYPAKHESEKVWLDNANGENRWKQIQRTMNNFVPRTEIIPEPIAYHRLPDLKQIVITEDDIPLVKLEGAILEPPPDEKRFPDTGPQLGISIQQMDKRMSILEDTIRGFSKSFEVLTEMIKQGKQEPKPEKSSFTCDVCSFISDSEHGLKIHRGREHK